MEEKKLTESDVRNIIEDYPAGRSKVIDDSNHTIDDHDDFIVYIFKNLTADRTLTFPSLSSHEGKFFKVINASGSYDVICDPGSDKINSYSSNVEITEKWGWWEFIGGDQWIGVTDGWSSVYEVSTETADNITLSTNVWDDVNLGANVIIPTAGTWLLDAFCMHRASRGATWSYNYGFFGIGETSGNVLPDIMYQNAQGIQLGGSWGILLYSERTISNYPHEFTSDSTQIYMKVNSQVPGGMSEHLCYGATNAPMYIKARRVA